MKGLLRNQFYGALGGVSVFLAFAAVAGIGLILFGDASFLTLFAGITIINFALNAVFGFKKEATGKWSKYELAAPVRRRDIVKSRYITHITLLLAGLAVSGLFVILAIAINGNRYFSDAVRDPLLLYCSSAGTALLIGAIFYPGVYLLGADKSDAVMMISLLGAVGITAGIAWLINAAYNFQKLSVSEFYQSVAVYTALTVAAFIASYFLTTFIYRRKDC